MSENVLIDLTRARGPRLNEVPSHVMQAISDLAERARCLVLVVCRDARHAERYRGIGLHIVPVYDGCGIWPPGQSSMPSKSSTPEE